MANENEVLDPEKKVETPAKEEAPAAKKEEAAPAKKEETPVAKVTPPEKYDLKLPEGSKLDAKHLEGIAAEAKARGLSQDDAQNLVERDSKARSAFDEQQAANVKVYLDKLMVDAKADKEIGGEGFAKNSELAKRVVDRFGTDEFKKTLNDSGLGNHPELVRIFNRIGKAMSEDQLVMPGTQVKTEKKSTAEVLYGDTTKT